MRCSLYIGGLEFALKVPRGPLEALVATRYEAYLGAVDEPVAEIDLSSPALSRADDGRSATDVAVRRAVAACGLEPGLALLLGRAEARSECVDVVVGSAATATNDAIADVRLDGVLAVTLSPALTVSTTPFGGDEARALGRPYGMPVGQFVACEDDLVVVLSKAIVEASAEGVTFGDAERLAARLLGAQRQELSAGQHHTNVASAAAS